MQTGSMQFDYKRYYDQNEQFSEFEEAKNKSHQKLWVVDHDEFGMTPEQKAEGGPSVIYDNYSETSDGPFQYAPVPRGLVKFVQSLLTFLEGSAEADYTRVEDVARYVLTNMDFADAYAPFTHMPLRMVPHQLYYTYKHKRTGGVLDPKEIEVFEVDPNWTYEPYRKAISALKHPIAVEAFRKGRATNEHGRPVTLEDVLDFVSTIVWDGKEFLDSWVYEWMESFYESELPSLMSEVERGTGVTRESFLSSDFLFWKASVVGAMVWLRSPNSLPFLCKYHPIYGSVLRFNHETNKPEIIPGSGGEVIVHRWDAYTHKHLDVFKNSPPGTCANCNIALHCTKLVNANAVAHPKCSCGRFVDLNDVEGYELHHTYGVSSNCSVYRNEHPIIAAFACQSCLGLLIEKKPPTQPCRESLKCPNTACPHHAGASYYMKTLNDRRKLLLTQRS